MKPESIKHFREDFQFFRLKRVMKISGLSKSSLYRHMSLGIFPRQVKIGAIGGAVGWRSDEIDLWLFKRFANAVN
jgi:prophage regulatory protein